MDVIVVFDVILVVISIFPAYYSIRTLLHIYKYEQLSFLKYEWVPILLAGLGMIGWIIESAFFDYGHDLSLRAFGIKDSTLFFSVGMFTIAVARFADTWGKYAKAADFATALTQGSKTAAKAPVRQHQ